MQRVLGFGNTNGKVTEDKVGAHGGLLAEFPRAIGYGGLRDQILA